LRLTSTSTQSEHAHGEKYADDNQIYVRGSEVPDVEISGAAFGRSCLFMATDKTGASHTLGGVLGARPQRGRSMTRRPTFSANAFRHHSLSLNQ
jgi:hypothetical protein